MLELIAPTTGLHAAWLASHAEWGPGQHEDGFGLGPEDDVESAEGFATWVAALNAESDPARAAVGRRSVLRWIVDGDDVLGGIALRAGDNDYTRWAGHVGYGVRPSARGRGVATWALARMLEEARASGMQRLLAVCAVDNAASAATISRNGGVFEGIGQTPFGPVQRYWIELDVAGSAG